MTTIISGEEWRQVAPLGADARSTDARDADVVAAARERIPSLRTAALRLRLVDRGGRPIPGLDLRLTQERHAFVFGCSAGGSLDARRGPAQIERDRLFTELFNGTHAKCYWDEKWHQPIETRQGHRELGTFLAELDWGCAHGLTVRGHPLVWTVPKAIPAWMRRYPYERQLAFLEHHVRSLIQAAAGRIKLWDLVNEMLWEPSLRNLPTRDWPHLESVDEMLTYIEPAMRWAREEDPTAAYVLNDYGLECTYNPLKGVTAAQQRSRFLDLVAALRERGAAPDAIGTQAHVGKWFPMSLVHQVFDDLARAGVPVQVSEFWAALKDHPAAEGRASEQIAEDRRRYVTDYYTVAFGHPAVDHISYWGGADFFDRDGWIPSPLYRDLHRLIRREWWTDLALQSDADGWIEARAFHGDHRLRWNDRFGNPHTRPLRIDPGRSQEGILVLD